MSRAVVELLAAQTAILDRIARALETLAIAQAPAPNFKRPLSAFVGFDWSDINAGVRERDGQGPTVVEWGGFTWTRRSGGDKKKGNAIWFSRVVSGTVGEGNVKWARLITFKDFAQAEPLDDRAAGAANAKKQDAPRTESPQPTKPAPSYVAADLPADAESFAEWQSRMKISGKAINDAIGTDVKGWFKLHAGKGYDDLAQELITTLALGEPEVAR